MAIDKFQFWRGISILLNNYHIINRKLFACEVTYVEQIVYPDNIKEGLKKDVFILNIEKLVNNDIKQIQYDSFVVHFKCIPKKNGEVTKATGVLNVHNLSFRMSFEHDALTDFEIQLLNNDINIAILNDSHIDLDKTRWLDFVLKPKFLKWCNNKQQNIGQECVNSNEKKSLRLIDSEKYNRLYNELKQKYCECAMKLWNEAQESTNPLKFIYEDLAIASYLITLWKSDLVTQPPIAFADLGCGNGLLVYILRQEGYQGYGYDVRSRKLWPLYPHNVSSCLYEATIEPHTFKFPNNVNWLIGNHSDELSPWVPVLATTCRENVNYFLLPCCAFEFSGQKFQRRNSAISIYRDFCEYAEKISNICGFKTMLDRLKIPSTKRIALIGLNHVYSKNENLKNRIQNIRKFIRDEQLLYSNSSLQEIKLREKTEVVRNCTQIDKSVIDRLVKKIFYLILENKSNEESNWKRGGRLTILQIAKTLDKDDLKQIKSECGGLKTLLRNKHEVFEFQSPDFVVIRMPKIQKRSPNKTQTVKKRQCFFKLNHPQGCPLTAEECTFLHNMNFNK